MMFGRKKKDEPKREAETPQEAAPADAWADTEDDFTVSPEADGVAEGPRDRADVTDVGHLINLGSVYALPVPGMELRLELDGKTQEVSALQMANDDGAVQVQVFAAPRSSGIWDEIRGEIAEMIPANGGTVEETTGPFGPELQTRLAQAGPDGRTVFAPAIFAGVDGPRWFLRAVYSGAPAIDETVRANFDACIRSIVVTRGDEPRAPREMLPLKMPVNARDAAQEPEADADTSDTAADKDDFKPFERGPEITEVR